MRLPLLTALVGTLCTAALAEPRILVYGDSNSWGWTPVETGFPTMRYPDDTTWPRVMQAALAAAGRPATVVVDALSGRTIATAYPEPQNGIDGAAFSGLADIASATAAELPIDLVIIMLGTNDARSDLGVAPEAAARGVTAMVARLAELNGGVGTAYPAPQVLVVAPPAIGDTSRTPIGAVTQGSDVLSNAIDDAIVGAGRTGGFSVIDARPLVTVGGIDGVHFTAQDHATLGQAMAEAVLPLLASQ